MCELGKLGRWELKWSGQRHSQMGKALKALYPLHTTFITIQGWGREWQKRGTRLPFAPLTPNDSKGDGLLAGCLQNILLCLPLIMPLRLGLLLHVCHDVKNGGGGGQEVVWMCAEKATAGSVPSQGGTWTSACRGCLREFTLGQERMSDCNWKRKGEDVMDCQRTVEGRGEVVQVPRPMVLTCNSGMGIKLCLIIAGYFFLELPASVCAPA